MARTKTKMSPKKVVAAITAVSLAAVMLVGGAFAWHDFSQSAINRTRGIVSPDVLLHDDFADEWIDGKREKDVYVENTGDVDTIVRIRFSEFLQIGNDKVVGTNSKDVKTWDIHKFDTATTGLPGHDASEAHKYFSWNMDGDQKVYLTDTSEMGYFEYKKSDYTFTVPHPITSTVMYSTQKGPNGQPYGETLPTAPVVSMAYYSVPANKTAIDAGTGCWIVDTDGWCYWSKQLKPGEATNMLLSSIQMIKNPNDNYAYNIYVDLQACNATEIGDMIGKGMTTEALENLVKELSGNPTTVNLTSPAGTVIKANATIKYDMPSLTNPRVELGNGFVLEPGIDGKLGTEDDFVKFGTYLQDGPTTANSPNSAYTASALKWKLLDIQGGKALLITEDIIDNIQRDTATPAKAWNDSNLRKWLNSEVGGIDRGTVGNSNQTVNGFLNTAFSAADRAKIANTTTITTDDGTAIVYMGPTFGEHGPDNSWAAAFQPSPVSVVAGDKVFALSNSEIWKYFGVSSQATSGNVGDHPVADYTGGVAKPTAYAQAKGCTFNPGTGVNVIWGGNGTWWTRSAGRTGDFASYVATMGDVSVRNSVTVSHAGARPAIWVTVTP